MSEVIFLTTLLTSSVCPLSHLKAEVRLGLAGQEATFPILSDLHTTPVSYEAYLYRETLMGTVLLKDSSALSQSNDTEQSQRVSCFFVARDAPRAFVLRNLSLSDSGDYMIEVWSDGLYRGWVRFHLTVCGGPVTAAREELADAIEWTLTNVSTSQGDTVQLYAQNLLKPSCPSQEGINTLILDTARSFKSLVSDLSVDVRSLSNGTSIQISNMSRPVSRVCGHILVRRGEECRLYSERKCTSLFGRTSAYVHFTRAGERFALACRPRSGAALGPVQWSTARDSRASRVPAAPANLSTVEAEPGVSVRNDSLVVAVATPDHSGRYCCTPEARPQARTPHWLFVCSQLSAPPLTLVWGDSVELRCYNRSEAGSEAKSESVVQWYRRRGPQQEDLLVEVDLFSTGRVQEDLGGRVSFSRFSLSITGLRGDDSGEYICRLWKGLNRRNASCLERRIEMVKRDFYRVYASLLGSALLGMICAVLCVTVRFKRPAVESAARKTGMEEGSLLTLGSTIR